VLEGVVWFSGGAVDAAGHELPALFVGFAVVCVVGCFVVAVAVEVAAAGGAHGHPVRRPCGRLGGTILFVVYTYE
jgi:hypothetical protein